jgi:Arc/MetJ family transcription regulator
VKKLHAGARLPELATSCAVRQSHRDQDLRCAKVMRMTRTTVDVDDRALAAARQELGTKGLSDTVNTALREAARRRVLQGFDVRRDIDGTPEEVREGRERL